MSRGRKRPKRPGVLRYIAARNVQLRMDFQYKMEPTATDRLKALAKDADVSVSTLGRLFDADTAPNLDTLERIALALGCSVTDLLIAPPEVLRALGFANDH